MSNDRPGPRKAENSADVLGIDAMQATENVSRQVADSTLGVSRQTGSVEVLHRMAETLDTLDVAVCVFDFDDCTILWNRTFLKLFPEHAGHVHRGEPYHRNLTRFYGSRLPPEKAPQLDRYVREGVERHRRQDRPYAFSHLGRAIKVASVPVEGIGRVRIWTHTSESSAVPAARAHPPQRAPADPDALLGQLADSVMLADLEGRITWVNEAFVELYGLADVHSAISFQFQDVYRAIWSDSSEAETTIRDALAVLDDNLRFFGSPFELPLPRGRWARVTIQRGPDGSWLPTHVDISLLKRQQRELQAAEERARSNSALMEAALGRMQQGVMMVSAEGTVEICNKRAIELLDLPVALMSAKPAFKDVLAFQWKQDEFRQTPQSLQDFIRSGGILDRPQSYERVRPDGRCIEVQSVPLEGGGVLRTYSDITARKKDEARILHVSRHDGLTSLVNRDVFLEHVVGAMNADLRFAVLYIDLDHFKPVNDCHGHTVGDKVLAVAADRMRSIARDCDVVARMGGDEFAVLQRDVVCQEVADGLAQRIASALSQPIQLDGLDIRIGASVGLALHDGSTQAVEELLKKADAAMYARKAQRKASVALR